MPDQKISADPDISSPTTQARLAGIDIGTDPTKNYQFGPTATKSWLGVAADITAASVAAASQFEVTTGTRALTRDTHQGATIILSPGATGISFSATTQGNGFIFVVKNRTGADWSVPTFAGGTRYFTRGQAHSQISAGGDASFEVLTRGGTLYVEIIGDTI